MTPNYSTTPAQSLTASEQAILLEAKYRWTLHARPKQLPPPGDWYAWLILAGRGFGKTRTGAEWIRHKIESGQAGRIALVGRTAADVRDTMIEGESGLLAVCPPWAKPTYEPSKRRVTWPNGAIATAFTGEEPNALRGPQHDAAWADELAAWKYPETWDQLQFGLRLGQRPQVVITTTPRPTPLVKSIVADSDSVTVRGTSYENRENLAPSFFKQIIQKYEGTRLGRQELNAELLEDVDGALWNLTQIDSLRVAEAPDLIRVIVAIDPATTSNAESNETGIIVAGLGRDGHGYVLNDVSVRDTPDGWARRAVNAYREAKADRIIYEANQGGDMVATTLRTIDRSVPLTAVTASRGKLTRAEPVSALYQQGRVHHVGAFAALEDQMTSWVPGEPSPDRMDALVWAITSLMITGGGLPFGWMNDD